MLVFLSQYWYSRTGISLETDFELYAVDTHKSFAEELGLSTLTVFYVGADLK